MEKKTIIDFIKKFLMDTEFIFSEQNLRNCKTYLQLRKRYGIHKDTLVISVLEVKLLKGLTWDKDDFYWEYETLKGTEQSSCVMDFVPLKGALPEADYAEIERLFIINQESNGKDNI